MAMEAVNSRKEAKPKPENQEERKITCISMESEKESKLAPARRTMTEKRVNVVDWRSKEERAIFSW